jgi:hypothetical protein
VRSRAEREPEFFDIPPEKGRDDREQNRLGVECIDRATNVCSKSKANFRNSPKVLQITKS